MVKNHYICIIEIKQLKQTTMKKTLFLSLIFGLFLLTLNSCSKNDVTTPCPNNPYTNTPLCGNWKDLTTSNDSVTEIWSIKRDNNQNTVSITVTKFGNFQYNYVFPFSIGTDTTFVRYDSQVIPGSGNATWKIENSLDTLILTKSGDTQKFIQN